jgi:hypothetical protein
LRVKAAVHQLALDFGQVDSAAGSRVKEMRSQLVCTWLTIQDSEKRRGIEDDPIHF